MPHHYLFDEQQDEEEWFRDRVPFLLFHFPLSFSRTTRKLSLSINFKFPPRKMMQRTGERKKWKSDRQCRRSLMKLIQWREVAGFTLLWRKRWKPLLLLLICLLLYWLLRPTTNVHCISGPDWAKKRIFFLLPSSILEREGFVTWCRSILALRSDIVSSRLFLFFFFEIKLG